MRLIDADDLIEDVTNRCSNDFLRKQFIEEFIDIQPTINTVERKDFTEDYVSKKTLIDIIEHNYDDIADIHYEILNLKVVNDNTLKELKSATFLIETLEIILSGYNRAATNMCAYEAYKKIKDWKSKHIKEDF